MIKLYKKLKMLEDYKTTLKEISYDSNNQFHMTNSELKVINYDLFTQKYCEDNCIRCINSNDGLYIAKNGKMIFIEFKNGDISNAQANIKIKCLTSFIILSDIIKLSRIKLKEKLSYILVYNESKNKFSEKEKKKLYNEIRHDYNRKFGVKELIEISGSFLYSNSKEEYIRFGLNNLKGFIFNEVHTYTEEEFEEKFIKKYEK